MTEVVVEEVKKKLSPYADEFNIITNDTEDASIINGEEKITDIQKRKRLIEYIRSKMLDSPNDILNILNDAFYEYISVIPAKGESKIYNYTNITNSFSRLLNCYSNECLLAFRHYNSNEVVLQNYPNDDTKKLRDFKNSRIMLLFDEFFNKRPNCKRNIFIAIAFCGFLIQQSQFTIYIREYAEKFFYSLSDVICQTNTLKDNSFNEFIENMKVKFSENTQLVEMFKYGIKNKISPKLIINRIKKYHDYKVRKAIKHLEPKPNKKKVVVEEPITFKMTIDYERDYYNDLLFFYPHSSQYNFENDWISWLPHIKESLYSNYLIRRSKTTHNQQTKMEIKVD